MLINRNTFSFDEMKIKLEGIVDNVLDELPKEVKLKLPKLKKD